MAAADAALLDLAVVERGAAMAAPRLHQASAAGPVAEQHQVLAQHPDFARRVAGMRDQADRMPIAAHQLAHRGAAANLGERRKMRRDSAFISGTAVDAFQKALIVHLVSSATSKAHLVN